MNAENWFSLEAAILYLIVYFITMIFVFKNIETTLKNKFIWTIIILIFYLPGLIIYLINDNKNVFL